MIDRDTIDNKPSSSSAFATPVSVDGTTGEAKKDSAFATPVSVEGTKDDAKATRRGSVLVTAACFLLPALPATFYFCDRPFSNVLATTTIGIADLTPQQKINIETAAKRLNGIVIRAGDSFSFNRIVGPRIAKRGYLPAPAYVGRDSIPSPGGGICVVSSAIYQDALRAGLKITKRAAHTRTMHTVEPGLDATVSDSGVDLRFSNNIDSPVAISTKYTPSEIVVKFLGNAHIANWQPCELNMQQRRIPNEILVSVTRKQFGKSELVSEDVYGISKAGERKR